MSPLQALTHLANLLLVPLALGALSAALAKGLWRQRLAGVTWRRLALWAMAVDVVAALLGLWWGGRDGLMATYAAMVVCCALALWWAGFGRRQR